MLSIATVTRSGAKTTVSCKREEGREGRRKDVGGEDEREREEMDRKRGEERGEEQKREEGDTVIARRDWRAIPVETKAFLLF